MLHSLRNATGLDRQQCCVLSLKAEEFGVMHKTSTTPAGRDANLREISGALGKQIICDVDVCINLDATEQGTCEQPDYVQPTLMPPGH